MFNNCSKKMFKYIHLFNWYLNGSKYNAIDKRHKTRQWQGQKSRQNGKLIGTRQGEGNHICFVALYICTIYMLYLQHLLAACSPLSITPTHVLSKTPTTITTAINLLLDFCFLFFVFRKKVQRQPSAKKRMSNKYRAQQPTVPTVLQWTSTWAIANTATCYWCCNET